MIVNKYRLSANVYDRESEDERIDVRKVFYLAVEGNLTEVQYFRGLSKHRKEARLDYRVDVEVLGRARSDTHSAPGQVVELLEEYLNLREEGLDSQSIMAGFPKGFEKTYDVELIKQYLTNPKIISPDVRQILETDLQKTGYDIKYRMYLKNLVKDEDEFGIVIDRDAKSTSSEGMEEIIRYCLEKGYKCYISNPCFELWLLMHHVDVYDEYKDRMGDLLENRKVSDMHSFISRELSEVAGHSKKRIPFKENYLPYIDTAVINAKKRPESSDPLFMIDEIGTNIWDLIEHLRKNTEI